MKNTWNQRKADVGKKKRDEFEGEERHIWHQKLRRLMEKRFKELEEEDTTSEDTSP